jgi:hypothetical protein
MDDDHDQRRRILLRLGERVATILRLDVACAWQAIKATVEKLDESIDAAIAAAKAFGMDNLAGGIITTRTPPEEQN